MSYIDKMQVAGTTYDIKDSDAATAEALAAEATAREGADGALQTAINAKQAALTETQLTAVNSGIDATKVGQIATNTSAIAGKQDALNAAQLTAVNSGIDSTKVEQIATNAGDIDTIEGKIPAQATSSNQLADKDFVNSSVATNTANYISDNGEPFSSLADLQAYSGTLTNNDYAFVVGTDAAGNTTYTRYKYNASTTTWAEEYVLNNSSFTADQWASVNSGITSGDVTKLGGIEAGAEVNDIDSISLNGTALTPDANKNVEITTPTYSDFTGTDGTAAGTHGLVPAPATTDAGKFLKADGTWDEAGSSVNVVQTTGTSTTDVMSQNAVASMVFPRYSVRGVHVIGIGYPKGGNMGINEGIGIGYSFRVQDYGIALGNSAQAVSHAVSIGYDSSARGVCSVAVGKGSSATQQGQFDIGTSGYGGGNGYNSSNYRLLTGVYDPQNDHDAATKGYVDAHAATTLSNSEFNSILENA